MKDRGAVKNGAVTNGARANGAVTKGAAPDGAMPTVAPTEADGDAAEARVRTVELIISLVLRIGVLTSLAVIVSGLVLDLVEHPALRSPGAQHRLLTPAAHYPHSIGAIFSGVASGDAISIVALGLLLLIATPVARVAVSVLTFVYERDPLFVAVTSGVLAVLIGSFALGKVGG